MKKSKLLIKYTLSSLLVGSVIFGIYVIKQEQVRKSNNAMMILNNCPDGSNIMFEASTPVFGEGLKVTCIYQVGQLTVKTKKSSI